LKGDPRIPPGLKSNHHTLNPPMKLLPILLASAALSPLASQAALIYGLTSTNGLIRFDSATPGTVTTVGTISQAGIVDIDFYPVNGALYGSTSTGSLYRIDTTTGSATLAVTPTTTLSGVTEIDFNPAADRLRVFAGNNNFRLTPDVFNNAGLTAGVVTADGTFSNAAVNLVGSAYTNNFDGTAATSLYSIDSVSNSLVLHSVGPAFSTVGIVGGLGFDVGLNSGFDIDQAGTAFLTNDNSLYTVNLATGSATSLGTVGGSGLVSIAAVAVPEASTATVLMATGLLALRRRRK
jgi:hypothetical protein